MSNSKLYANANSTATTNRTPTKHQEIINVTASKHNDNKRHINMSTNSLSASSKLIQNEDSYLHSQNNFLQLHSFATDAISIVASNSSNNTSTNTKKSSFLNRRDEIIYNLDQLKHENQLKQITSQSDDELLTQLPKTLAMLRAEVKQHATNVNQTIDKLKQKVMK
jgi:flagellar basal body rod protein FlgC